MSMICPKCGDISQVRGTESSFTVSRLRVCKNKECRYRWMTVEIAVSTQDIGKYNNYLVDIKELNKENMKRAYKEIEHENK